MRLNNANHLINHVRRLLAAEMDVNIEIRGPKGWGKSAFALALARCIEPGFQDFKALVYSHKDYADRYREIRKARIAGDQGVKFIWVDDAARIFDRRAHMTKKNRAMLTINRTMRSQIRSVQILLTQDDLLESPLREGGNYVLFILDRPYHAVNYWLKPDPYFKGEPRLMRGFPTGWANPVVAYPGLWREYMGIRARMTDDLTDELLEDIAPVKAVKQKRDPVKLEAVVALRSQGLSQAAIGEKLGVSRQRVYQLLVQARQIDTAKPGQDSGSQGLPGLVVS